MRAAKQLPQRHEAGDTSTHLNITMPLAGRNKYPSSRIYVSHVHIPCTHIPCTLADRL